MKLPTIQENQDLQQAVKDFDWVFEPKLFASYDEAYFILKCYYHDLLGFSVIVPDVIKDGVLITLHKEGTTIELLDGWEILEDGELLTENYFAEIVEMIEVLNAKHPMSLTSSMDAFERMAYWHLEHHTNIVITKRERAARVKTYLMHNPNSGLYKIGKSINPERRAVEIQGMAGNPLDLLYVIHSDVEHELHTSFATQNHYSEWFTDEGGSIQAYFKLNGVAQ